MSLTRSIRASMSCVVLLVVTMPTVKAATANYLRDFIVIECVVFVVVLLQSGVQNCLDLTQES